VVGAVATTGGPAFVWPRPGCSFCPEGADEAFTAPEGEAPAAVDSAVEEDPETGAARTSSGLPLVPTAADSFGAGTAGGSVLAPGLVASIPGIRGFAAGAEEARDSSLYLSA